MHLLLIPDWDTDGESLKACNLPAHVIVINAHDGADKDQEYLDNDLSEALSDTFGFCHNGFEVEPITFTDGRYNLPGKPRESKFYMVGMMEATEKDVTLEDRQQTVAQACLSYAYSNVDDINDAFAHYKDENEGNESGQIKVGDTIIDSISEKDIESLAAAIGLPPIAD